MIQLNFTNHSTSQLGVPLPAGDIRFFSVTDKGERVVIGGGVIGNILLEEEVSVPFGNALDIKAKRVALSSGQVAPRVREEVYRVTLTNLKSEAVTIKVTEKVPQAVSISSSNIPYTMIDTSTVVFLITLEADTAKELEYTLQFKF